MRFPFGMMVRTLQAEYRDDVPSMTKLAARERDPFSVLIGCILSLRTKDEVTEAAMERLLKKARTPREMLSLPVSELARTIYPVGFYKTKAKHIREISRILLEKYSGSVPSTIE